MSELVVSATLVVAGYVLGSIPVGWLLSRRRGLDIRTVGSGNIGATNVARSLGKRLGALVLALDALKGAVPVVAAQYLASRGAVDVAVIAATGLAAIVGHCFPVWLGFRGGKGVATGLGVMLAVAPLATGLAALVFAAVYALTRIASLGSLCATSTLVVLVGLFDRGGPQLVLVLAAAAVIVYQHRANIGRLLRGAEHQV
jgi:acyl phosphate:glycerol-3-phosphate acyltransferase